MHLARFDRDAAAQVAAWATTAEEVMAWCSRNDESVPADVVAHWGDAPDVSAFGLFDADRLIGYGELWVDHDERECELARVIIAPQYRSRGAGRRLAGLLVGRARAIYPETFLRVLPDNVAARRCYLAAGFVRVPEEEEAEWNDGQPVEYVWMSHPG